MYIIVGLGNPKKEYDNTRHNIGFDVIDALANANRIGMTEKKHKAIIGKGIVDRYTPNRYAYYLMFSLQET